MIIDDEPEIRAVLTRYLSAEGFSVISVGGGKEARGILAKGGIDLVLLDIGLKNESGTDLLKKIITRSGVPVVILTGRSEPIERIVSLELGADDYIVKPFLKRELLARINAVLRRTSLHRHPQRAASETKPTKLRINNWQMDLETRHIEAQNGGRVMLTGAEFDMLAMLVHNVGKVVSRDELSRSALKRAWVPSDRSVDIHIHNLRRKLPANGSDHDIIVAIRNVGYVLTAKVEKL